MLELERRQQEDLLFAQMMGIHQETVDTYLEDVILESLDQTSSQKARDIVQEQADKLLNAVPAPPVDESRYIDK